MTTNTAITTGNMANQTRSLPGDETGQRCLLPNSARGSLFGIGSPDLDTWIVDEIREVGPVLIVFCGDRVLEEPKVFSAPQP
jgi:hypothetical protein